MINRLISALSGNKQCRPEASSAWTCVGIKKQRSIVHVLWNPHEGWRQRAEALIKSGGRKVGKYMGHFFRALFETNPGVAQLFQLLNPKLEFEGWQWGRWGFEALQYGRCSLVSGAWSSAALILTVTFKAASSNCMEMQCYGISLTSARLPLHYQARQFKNEQKKKLKEHQN